MHWLYVAHFECRRFDWHISGSQKAAALSPVARSHFHVWACVKWMTAINKVAWGGGSWLYYWSSFSWIIYSQSQSKPETRKRINADDSETWQRPLKKSSGQSENQTNTTTLLFVCDLTHSPGCLIYNKRFDTSSGLQLLHLEMTQGVRMKYETFLKQFHFPTSSINHRKKWFC